MEEQPEQDNDSQKSISNSSSSSRSSSSSSSSSITTHASINSNSFSSLSSNGYSTASIDIDSGLSSGVESGPILPLFGYCALWRDNAGEEAAPPATAAEPKTRCDKCNKKLGLTGGFPCRCGGTYCAYHRYSDRHECNFDYRTHGAEEIRRDNPVVVASKLTKL